MLDFALDVSELSLTVLLQHFSEVEEHETTWEGGKRNKICKPGIVDKYIILLLLHDWEGNTGKYSVRGWQYWPERSKGQY